MNHTKTFSIVSGFLFLAANTALWTQELEDLLPGLRERAVVLNITARILEKDSQEIWNSSTSKVTIPGKAVGIKLVGDNLVVVIQFIPYLRRDGNNILVAQGQIWIDVPDHGISYQTTMQTIPIAFGEQIYFLPLGSGISREGAYIEILLELRPYITDKHDEGTGNEVSTSTENK
jgi:hypothetical protein